jgi:hemerythrin superfamily protein
MNKAEIERLQGEPLKELLEKYGGWPVIDKSWNATQWDFMNHFVKAHRELDASPFFQVFVDLDLKNSSVNVINVSTVNLNYF